MGLVLDGVRAKVQAALPDQIGTNTRWDTTTIDTLIKAVDRIVRERVEASHDTAVISLTDATVGYEIPVNFITITKVEFALDGTNYDWLLQPRSLTDLDSISYTWRTDRSARPDFYSLLSAPGVLSDSGGSIPSKIYLTPVPAVAGSATIRLSGLAVPEVGDYTTARVPDDVQVRCHVPLVLANLLAVQEPELAFQYYQRGREGIREMANRFKSQYKDRPARGSFG